jgi:hypothetical protein
VGEQVTITLLVPGELKARLQAKALANNRTLSHEAQRRLERSFSVQELQEDAIALAVEEALAKISERMASELEKVRGEKERAERRAAAAFEAEMAEFRAEAQKLREMLAKDIERARRDGERMIEAEKKARSKRNG